MRKLPWLVVAVPIAAFVAASPSCGGEAVRANPPRPAAAAAPPVPVRTGPPRPTAAPAPAPVQCASGAECREGGKRLAGGGAAEKARAAEYFSLGCQKDDGEACASLAEILKEGTDVKRAFEAYQRACDLKQLAACRALGGYYLSGSPGVVPQNPGKAAQIFDRTCKAGHAGSCVDLATLYDEGKGVKRNPKKAARLRTKAEVFEGIE